MDLSLDELVTPICYENLSKESVYIMDSKCKKWFNIVNDILLKDIVILFEQIRKDISLHQDYKSKNTIIQCKMNVCKDDDYSRKNSLEHMHENLIFFAK